MGVHGAAQVPAGEGLAWSPLTLQDEVALLLLETAICSPITMSMPSELLSTQDPTGRPSLNRPRREGFDKKCSSSFNASTVVLACR